ncbi:hypothetical protein ILUMI_22758 [Ignelater luminosus]|uniref:Uncharacterized protein n=1 Tax=Ignelater luminosus TaxID=2038154 RepID=A0A8K0G2I3_IGNLU|nr:hypothetical protein ILUMI_22758 [Ignelater luminosus]
MCGVSYQLQKTTDKYRDNVMVMGDLNGKVESNHASYKEVVGRSIYIDGAKLELVESFKYLRSVIHKSDKIGLEVTAASRLFHARRTGFLAKRKVATYVDVFSEGDRGQNPKGSNQKRHHPQLRESETPVGGGKARPGKMVWAPD